MFKSIVSKIIFCTFIVLVLTINVQANNETALLLIDIQNFYFPGGFSELENPEQASLNAQKILQKFRTEKKLVIHVKHNAKSEAEIHKDVAPIAGEKVIIKDHISCFRETDLLEYLKANKIKKLVICGMMTHMCVEAATRTAADFGFECIIIHDACATKSLEFNNIKIKAVDVHNSTLSTLKGTYAKVTDTKTFLNRR